MDEKTLDFAIFCIESLAERLGISGKEAYKLMTDTETLQNYIIPCYEALHTQGKNYIVDDIIEVLRERGGLE